MADNLETNPWQAPDNTDDFDYPAELLRLYQITLDSAQGTPKYRRGPLIDQGRKLVTALAQALGIPTIVQLDKSEHARELAEARVEAEQINRNATPASLVSFKEALNARRSRA